MAPAVVSVVTISVYWAASCPDNDISVYWEWDH
jgi:hypothetical protein